jgi:hypothetical protein
MAGPRSLAPRLDTREALLLAFFATFVVLARAALRWHLHLPGHSMLPTALLLVLARACVPRAGAASIVGLLAGAASALLGMGQGGPLLLLKLGLPGVAVDLCLLSAPARGFGPARAALAGAAAGASDFVPVALVETLAGLAPGVVLAHAAVSAGAKAAFGVLGGAAGALVAERLRHHGLIPAA